MRPYKPPFNMGQESKRWGKLGRRYCVVVILVMALVAILLSTSARLYAGPIFESPIHSQLHPFSRDAFTPHVPARAIVYQRADYILLLVRIGWRLFGLWLLLRFRLLTAFVEAAYRKLNRTPPIGPALPPFIVIAATYLAFTFLLICWSLPFGLAGFALEHHYGFSSQTLAGYFKDLITSVLFDLPEIPILWIGYWLYSKSPARWWLWLWAAIVPLMLGAIVLDPIVRGPAFNHFSALPQGPLRDKILAFAGGAGISGASVFVEDTSRRTRHVNAYVNGLGPTTQIVIDDTALKTLPEDQLLAMVGHEMGHYVEGHIWYGFASGALGAFLFCWIASRLLPWGTLKYGRAWGFRGLNDPAALPFIWLVLTVFILVQEPIANFESRYMEHRADAFGLRTTHLTEATARLMVGFAERDYTDPDPPVLIQFWFGTHPTLKERIAFALQFDTKKQAR